MVVAPIAVAILIGVVAGALRRGRLASLARIRLRRPVLLALAVLCALGADVFDIPAPAVVAFIGLLAGIGFAASNLLIPGMFVVGIGVVVNLVPVALNGAMPVRGQALVDAEMVAEADLERVELHGARELADSGTTFEVLGDVIPVPQFDQVMSFGDLIILVGLADVIANLMRARRPARLPRGAGATLIALGWDVPPDDDLFVDLRASIDESLTRPQQGDVGPLDGPGPDRGVAPPAPPAAPGPGPVASPDSRAASEWARDSVSAFSGTEPW